MATDSYMSFAGVELINHARTVALAESLGIDTVWIRPEDVDWIQPALPDTSTYGDITTAPWYDANYPASMQFAGFISLAMQGLNDSTEQSVITEYINDGGASSSKRNATLPIVASVVVVASTDEGADFGVRWLSHRLKGNQPCDGDQLRYFRYENAVVSDPARFAHRNGVVLTRGVSVTRKRVTACSATLLTTFTMTATDPFEYGDPITLVQSLGQSSPSLPVSGSTSGGPLMLTETGCPSYDYTPVYDPLYPALVAPPTAPDIPPAGWSIAEGDSFQRWWVKVPAAEPNGLDFMPIIELVLNATTAVRYTRVSIFSGSAATDTQCDPYFSVVSSYLPPGNGDLNVNGEARASYFEGGDYPVERRADSVVFSPDAGPVDWSAFNDPSGLLIVVDVFDTSNYADANVSVVSRSN